MKLRFLVRVDGAFPFPPLGRHVGGIRGRSYQSFEGGAVHLRIEVATTVHT